MRTRSALPLLVAIAALGLAVLSLVMLERERAGVSITRMELGASPATLYRAAGPRDAPLVVIAHGFGGSRQMMEALSLSLARSGHAVVAFDFLGHGRMDMPMSPDVTAIEGTTQGLVAQTIAVAQDAAALPGVGPGRALVGHSMATDVILRAADRMGGAAALVAISMYSDTVSASFPDRLLIVSGQWETRLRAVALEALRQLDPDAPEGTTARAGAMTRRAVVAPHAEHVGVLWSATTLTEARDWINAALPAGAPAPVARTGPWIGLLLGAILALGLGLARALPRRKGAAGAPLPAKVVLVALALAPLPAAGAALMLADGALGFASFGRLAAFFGVWGGVQIAVLLASGWRPRRPDMAGLALVLVWSAGVFALALDRYGASFVPTGARLPLMGILALGTLPFMLADAALTEAAGLWRRLAVRVLPIAVLAGSMLGQPGAMGYLFTVLPVMVLFHLVFSTLARRAALQRGAEGPGLALGVLLAWSIAASTPLFSLAG